MLRPEFAKAVAREKNLEIVKGELIRQLESELTFKKNEVEQQFKEALLILTGLNEPADSDSFKMASAILKRYKDQYSDDEFPDLTAELLDGMEDE